MRGLLTYCISLLYSTAIRLLYAAVVAVSVYVFWNAVVLLHFETYPRCTYAQAFVIVFSFVTIVDSMAATVAAHLTTVLYARPVQQSSSSLSGSDVSDE